MRPGNLFQLEMATILANKRTLAMKLGFPLLLAFPFVVFAMPLKVKVAGLAMLVIFTSFFGAAVSFVRRRTDGHLMKLKLLPLPRWIVFSDFLLAGTAVDLIQVGIVLALFILINGTTATFAALIVTAGAFFAAALMLNLVGMLLGMAMKSNPEIHLFGALGAGVMACISGIMPMPARIQKIVNILTPWNPISRLATSLEGIVKGAEMNQGATFVFSIIFVIVLLGVFLIRAFDWK